MSILFNLLHGPYTAVSWYQCISEPLYSDSLIFLRSETISDNIEYGEDES